MISFYRRLDAVVSQNSIGTVTMRYDGRMITKPWMFPVVALAG
jgi:hypothetical protein